MAIFVLGILNSGQDNLAVIADHDFADQGYRETVLTNPLSRPGVYSEVDVTSFTDLNHIKLLIAQNRSICFNYNNK